MRSAREDVAFIARSENRVKVLATLSPEPIERNVLRERAGVERVTLGRILADFEDRVWVEKTGRQYALTPTGEIIANTFKQLLETVETTRKLESVVQWLPIQEMPFPLELLGGADITLPSGPDPAAPTRVAGQRLVQTENVRLIMSVIVAEVVEACWEATTSGTQQLEAVFTPDVIKTIATDPVMSQQVEEMLESGHVTVYQSDEEFPFIMGLLDDFIAFGVTDEEDLPRAYFEIENETVRSWVEETYHEYLETAEQVHFDAIPK
jgi:predicted transcriptional regulator